MPLTPTLILSNIITFATSGSNIIVGTLIGGIYGIALSQDRGNSFSPLTIPPFNEVPIINTIRNIIIICIGSMMYISFNLGQTFQQLTSEKNIITAVINDFGNIPIIYY